MTTRKKPEPETVEGLALVDIPRLAVRCGQWVSLPADEAQALIEAGEFDPKAPKPE